MAMIRDGRNSYRTGNRPFGKPRPAAVAGTQREAAGRDRDAERRTAAETAAAQARKEAAEKKRLREQREKAQREYQEKVRALKDAARRRKELLEERRRRDRMTPKQRENDQLIPREGESTEEFGARQAMTDEALNERIAQVNVKVRDLRNERRMTGKQARQADTAWRVRTGRKIEDPEAEQRNRLDSAEREAFAKNLERNGYRIARDRDGKVIGAIDVTKQGYRGALTPEEMENGQYDLFGETPMDAGFIDPHGSQGIQFVDRFGQTGRYVKGEGDKQKEMTAGEFNTKLEAIKDGKGQGSLRGWEWQAYTAYDWYQEMQGGGAPAGSDQLRGLAPLQKQGAILVSDEGETWLRKPETGAFGFEEGGKKVPGTWKTPQELMAEKALLEKNDPNALRELQNRLYLGGFYKNMTPGSDPAPITGQWDRATDSAYREFLDQSIYMRARTGEDLDDYLQTQIDAYAVYTADSGGGGGGGGGGATSYSATDPATLKIYAQQAAQAVLGRLPNEQEVAAAVAQVQAAEATEGAKSAGAIINVDPQARFVEYFRNSNPTEFQAKNVADAVGLFSKMIGEGGLLGSGLASSSINQGAGG